MCAARTCHAHVCSMHICVCIACYKPELQGSHFLSQPLVIRALTGRVVGIGPRAGVVLVVRFDALGRVQGRELAVLHVANESATWLRSGLGVGFGFEIGLGLGVRVRVRVRVRDRDRVRVRG